MAGDGAVERRDRRRRAGPWPGGLGPASCGPGTGRLEPDGRIQVGNRLVEPAGLQPQETPAGQQAVTDIVVGLQLQGAAVVGLGGLEGVRRVPPVGLVPFLARRSRHAAGTARPGRDGSWMHASRLVLAALNRLGLLAEVADGQQEMGRGLIGVALHGRLEGTDRVREPAAKGELATIEEVVDRGRGLDCWPLDARGPGPRRRRRARGNRPGGGGRQPSIPAKPDRPVEDPQALGRIRRLGQDQQQVVAAVANPGLLDLR